MKFFMNAGFISGLLGFAGIAGAIETGKGLLISVVLLIAGILICLIGSAYEKKNIVNASESDFRVGYLPRG